MSRLHDPLRRRLLLAGGGLLAFNACTPSLRVRAAPVFTTDPFTLGVASGDPQPDGFVLWTRLAPDPLNGGGMPPQPVAVHWEVADDENFARVLAAGTDIALPEWAHSVHVEVAGLAPDRRYCYRFRCGEAISPVGHVRTAPAHGSRPAALRLAYASCQHYEAGYYGAYRHLAEDRPDLVLHLGDYIYETSLREPLRRHEAGEPQTLEQYRNRYACYKRDRDLQAAHAACAWLCTWDDHEVDNDYAGLHDQDGSPPDSFAVRRAAAYQAYWEHLPLRLASRPQQGRMRLHRHLRYGDLLDLYLLDTRQYRDDQACAAAGKGGGQVLTDCAALADPARSMLGNAQEAWLQQQLADSRAHWNLVAQPMLMAPLDQSPGAPFGSWSDGWDGYPAARRRLLDGLARTSNPVVIGGDIHSYWANEIALEPGQAPIATEFVGTSISSGGVPYDRFAALLPENPQVRFFDSRARGYVLCELARERLDVAFRAVHEVRDPATAAHTLARFAVETGHARVLRA